MASLINTILGDALSILSTEAETYKPQILAAAAAANVTLETAVDGYINSLKVGGALGLVLPSLKPSLVTAINNSINSGAATQEAFLFDAIVSAAQNEAKKLAA